MSRSKRAWTFQEVDRLRRLYPRSREDIVARSLRRSVESIRRKAREVFGGETRRGPWSEAEVRCLREGYGALTTSSLCLVLQRTVRDVRGKIRELRNNLKSGEWSAEERAFLKKHYGHRKNRDLVVCLSRPLAEIRDRAHELALAKDKRVLPRPEMPRWTEAEVDRLRQEYPGRETVELARDLGRSAASVANKANQLGLRKDEALLRRIGSRNVSTRYR